MVEIKWECELLYKLGGAKSQAGTGKAEPAPLENKKNKGSHATTSKQTSNAQQQLNSIATYQTDI